MTYEINKQKITASVLVLLKTPTEYVETHRTGDTVPEPSLAKRKAVNLEDWCGKADAFSTDKGFEKSIHYIVKIIKWSRNEKSASSSQDEKASYS